MEKGRCPSQLSPLLARSYCQGDGLKGWSEHSIVQENGGFIDNKIKQTNKNYTIGENRLATRLGKAGSS